MLEDKEKYHIVIIKMLLIENRQLLKKLHIYDENCDETYSDTSSSYEKTHNIEYTLRNKIQLVDISRNQISSCLLSI